jgi:hypothetical protein
MTATGAVSEMVAEALRSLARGGKLTPSRVVDAARNPDHPLHTHFDWDDSAAAELWRVEQARRLIRSVRVDVQVKTMTLSAPYYVRTPGAGASRQSYTATPVIARDEDMARMAVLREVNAARAALVRALAVAGAVGMDGEIRSILTSLDRLRDM